MTTPTYTIIYDTLCGWCWGGAEVLDALVASDAEVNVLHRYLFQGDNAIRQSDRVSAYMGVADAKIADRTGQKFSAAYIANVQSSQTEEVESGLTADAAALVHDLGTEAEFAIYRQLQKRRYVDGVPPSDRDDIVAVLKQAGIDSDIAELVGSPQARERAQEISRQAISAMERAGAVGVPAVIRHDGDTSTVIDVADFYANPAAIADYATAGLKRDA